MRKMSLYDVRSVGMSYEAKNYFKPYEYFGSAVRTKLLSFATDKISNYALSLEYARSALAV